MTIDSTRHFVEVSNISSTIETSDLKDLLECFGHVKQIDMHQKGMRERVCIAQFGSREQCQAAVSLTGTKLGDMEIKVRQKDFSEAMSLVNHSSAVDVVSAGEKHRPKDKNNQGTIEADRWRDDQIKRTIYVGNLSHHISEDHVRAFFGREGAIKFIKMSGPGMDNPYCFIEFFEAAAAQKAYNLNGSGMNGRPLRIGRVKNPVGITGVKKDILNNPLKLSQAMSSARLALQALEMKKKQQLIQNSKHFTPVDEVKIEVKQNRRRSSRSVRSHRSRSRSRPGSRSLRRHRSRTRSRSRSFRRRRSRSASWSSPSRSRSRRRRRRRRRSSRSHSRGRRRNSSSGRSSLARSHRNKPKSKKPEMVWDGFNWHPLTSAEGQAMKKGEEIGAAGPRVGSSPGYIIGKGFLGA